MSDHRHPVDPERVAAAAHDALSADQARQLGELLTIVAEPVRTRILSALHASEPMCVGDIALALDLSEDAVSYGLRMLRSHGLVVREARGRMGYYQLTEGPNRAALTEALACLRRLTTET